MVHAEDGGVVGGEDVDLPQRLVGGERRREGELGDVVVDGVVVGDGGIGGEAAPVDEEVAVDVDGGPPPPLAAAAVPEHEAAEAGVLEHDGVLYFRLEGVEGNWVFSGDDAVYYLVGARLQEEAAGRRQRLVGLLHHGCGAAVTTFRMFCLYASRGEIWDIYWCCKNVGVVKNKEHYLLYFT